ncbi:hypothetical protein PPGU19_086110 (plasmid) [Paraburkholderia sp. PGU19]|nr:hypothetical protein PPGU19_086110 [Paraburkholderia sp. PGU19]
MNCLCKWSTLDTTGASGGTDWSSWSMPIWLNAPDGWPGPPLGALPAGLRAPRKRLAYVGQPLPFTLAQAKPLQQLVPTQKRPPGADSFLLQAASAVSRSERVRLID